MRFKSSDNSLVLQTTVPQTIIWQSGLILAAVVMPALTHVFQLPVRWLLPMHWPVILAGLLFGWRSGLLVGLAAPLTNHLITSYQQALIFPSMTIELVIYGFISGWMREKYSTNIFLSVAIALIAGRVFFILSVLIIGYFDGSFINYILTAMSPGIVAGLCQLVLLPLAVLYLLKGKSY